MSGGRNPYPIGSREYNAYERGKRGADNWEGLAGIIYIPAIVPPGLLAYWTWVWLDWLHPFFKLIILGGELLVVFILAVKLIGNVSRHAAAAIGGSYMAICYGGFFLWSATGPPTYPGRPWNPFRLSFEDGIWVVAIACTAAVIGYWGMLKIRSEN